MFDSLRQALSGSPSRPTPNAPGLPLYSPLSTDTFESSSSSGCPSASTDDIPLPALQPAQRHAALPQRQPWLPSLPRFLADFTLGFADGLTVPFALTAGLSSLGQTDTVIYAGMAEICAGSISMGIGGYLSAKGEAGGADNSNAGSMCDEDENEKAGRVVDRYLAPLDLPPELLGLVREHVGTSGSIAAALGRELAHDTEDGDGHVVSRPAISGLSVALGYLIGGSLPLFPYFLVGHVGDGLLWSFIVCVVALFAFGFTKDFVLHRKKEGDEVWVNEKKLGKQGWRWADLRRSSWEGCQIVMLGSIAALAAVFCVRLFDRMGYNGPEP